ncbi:hypothetical protein TNCV_4858391 [Trichonephila clavipes]|nr:hypothetical protein TNCV_4858391 [Trichonephila clavipes]
MSSGRSLLQFNLGVQGGIQSGIQGDSHNSTKETCLPNFNCVGLIKQNWNLFLSIRPRNPSRFRLKVNFLKTHSWRFSTEQKKHAYRMSSPKVK